MKVEKRSTPEGKVEVGLRPTFGDKLLGFIILIGFPIGIIAPIIYPRLVELSATNIDFLALFLLTGLLLYIAWIMKTTFYSTHLVDKIVYDPTNRSLTTFLNETPQTVYIDDYARIKYTEKYTVWARFSGLPDPKNYYNPAPVEYPLIGTQEGITFVFDNMRTYPSKFRRWWANITGRPDLAEKYNQKNVLTPLGEKPVYIDEYSFHGNWEITVEDDDNNNFALFTKKFDLLAYIKDYGPYAKQLAQQLSEITGLPLETDIETIEELSQVFKA